MKISLSLEVQNTDELIDFIYTMLSVIQDLKKQHSKSDDIGHK